VVLLVQLALLVRKGNKVFRENKGLLALKVRKAFRVKLGQLDHKVFLAKLG
jgi:hypothetical protein